MKLSSSASALAVSALLLATAALAQDTAVATPSPTAILSAIQYKGCYAHVTGFEDQGPYVYQSAGWCQKVCGALNKPVMATQKGSNCWCADLLPASSAKVSDSECNSPCDGFDQAMCGGESTWSVSLDGLLTNVGSQDSSSDSSSSGSSGSSAKGSSTSGSKSSTASPSVITEAGQTIVVTATGDSQPTSQSSGGPSKAGIAAGVVAGVLVSSAIFGGLFFFLRTRKRKSVQEAYRRNAAINSFVQGGGRKQASEGSDSRLDPSIMVQRRQSDGSIADNQDYSRRILRVANPDGT